MLLKQVNLQQIAPITRDEAPRVEESALQLVGTDRVSSLDDIIRRPIKLDIWSRCARGLYCPARPAVAVPTVVEPSRPGGPESWHHSREGPTNADCRGSRTDHRSISTAGTVVIAADRRVLAPPPRLVLRRGGVITGHEQEAARLGKEIVRKRQIPENNCGRHSSIGIATIVSEPSDQNLQYQLFAHRASAIPRQTIAVKPTLGNPRRLSVVS